MQPSAQSQLFHDVEGYKHSRVARYLGIGCSQSQSALHEARLRLRQLLALGQA
jgi:DNA-directed RNA polymerase specialized sigma24 family protein